MKITFLGTRGYIDIKSRRHKWHASTLIEYKGTRVMIDCGIDWTNRVFGINPDAIVITHAHPDHAWGLKNGSPCSVYAAKESWEIMEKYPITKKQRHVVKAREPFFIGAIKFELFHVIHSIRAPGVGYRITAGNTIIFCVHDLISINQRHAALKDVSLYIGDGATINRPLVRRKGNKIFGHTTIRAQLGWCQKEKVPQAIFTHCGTQIVGADGRKVGAQIRAMGKERGVVASIAYDGLEITI
jgi:phosphoribosyl 1,2-cyclic phosphodiesterase